jgi:hypothetical protein
MVLLVPENFSNVPIYTGKLLEYSLISTVALNEASIVKLPTQASILQTNDSDISAVLYDFEIDQLAAEYGITQW